MSNFKTPTFSYRLRGPTTLEGHVSLSGSANAGLAAMCAALLTDQTVVLKNIPDVLDVKTLAELLSHFGAVITKLEKNTLSICCNKITKTSAPAHLMSANRASFQVTGPLLARYQTVSTPPPGGDPIGGRPVDVHINSFAKLGAQIDQAGDVYTASASGGLQGTRIFMDYPSVSGTQNVLMAATLAKGDTTIVNAATEPEVIFLGNLLTQMGAVISGTGTQVIKIHGVEKLNGCEISLPSDRIEAGTFAIAAALTAGNVTIENAPVEHLDSLFSKLIDCGANLKINEKEITVSRDAALLPVNFQSLPYPGMPTDLQAPMATLLTQASGVSIVQERVFENRMLYVNELRKMGADIVIAGTSAIISGPSTLSGAKVTALDVRAGAAVLLAALSATGTSVITEIQHLDRKYDSLQSKFESLGAKMERS